MTWVAISSGLPGCLLTLADRWCTGKGRLHDLNDGRVQGGVGCACQAMVSAAASLLRAAWQIGHHQTGAAVRDVGDYTSAPMNLGDSTQVDSESKLHHGATREAQILGFDKDPRRAEVARLAESASPARTDNIDAGSGWMTEVETALGHCHRAVVVQPVRKLCRSEGGIVKCRIHGSGHGTVAPGRFSPHRLSCRALGETASGDI